MGTPETTRRSLLGLIGLGVAPRIQTSRVGGEVNDIDYGGEDLRNIASIQFVNGSKQVTAYQGGDGGGSTQSSGSSGIVWADATADDMGAELNSLLEIVGAGSVIGIPIGEYTVDTPVEITKDVAIIGPAEPQVIDGVAFKPVLKRSVDAPIFTGGRRLTLANLELHKSSDSDTTHLIDCTDPTEIRHCLFDVAPGTFAVRLSTDGGSNINHSRIGPIAGRGGDGAVLIQDTAKNGNARVMQIEVTDWRNFDTYVVDAETRSSYIVVHHGDTGTRPGSHLVAIRDLRNWITALWTEGNLKAVDCLAGNQWILCGAAGGGVVDSNGRNGVSVQSVSDGSMQIGGVYHSPTAGLSFNGQEDFPRRDTYDINGGDGTISSGQSTTLIPAIGGSPGTVTVLNSNTDEGAVFHFASGDVSKSVGGDGWVASPPQDGLQGVWFADNRLILWNRTGIGHHYRWGFDVQK